MIYVDSATGSNSLIDPLRRLGLPVEEARLRSGDLWWVGRGVKGEPLRIGVEFKKIGELAQSLESERLQGHQLLEMHQNGPGDGKGGYDRCYLLVEGDFGSDELGRGTLFKAKRTRKLHGVGNAVELEKRLHTLMVRGGLFERFVPDRRTALRVIQAWYRCWTDKDLDKHKSHLGLYAPDLDSTLKVPVSDFRRMAAQIPGIGFTRSEAVADYFSDDPESMMSAGIEEWAEITSLSDDGKARRIGESQAKKIWAFLHPGPKRRKR